jgi:hypothetical protein
MRTGSRIVVALVSALVVPLVARRALAYSLEVVKTGRRVVVAQREAGVTRHVALQPNAWRVIGGSVGHQVRLRAKASGALQHEVLFPWGRRPSVERAYFADLRPPDGGGELHVNPNFAIGLTRVDAIGEARVRVRGEFRWPDWMAAPHPAEGAQFRAEGADLVARAADLVRVFPGAARAGSAPHMAFEGVVGRNGALDLGIQNGYRVRVYFRHGRPSNVGLASAVQPPSATTAR